MEFLKHCLQKGKDYVTYIDESLYLEFSTSAWWIDSGVTVYVANSLQGFHTTQRLEQGDRTVSVTDGKEADVQAIGDLKLELDDGFVLHLSNVLYVPSLRRNLIYVLRLDDENIHFHFGNKRCIIQCNKKDVGLAIRRDMLYLLSHCNVVNEIDASGPALERKNSKRK